MQGGPLNLSTVLHPATENRPDTFTQVNGKTHVPGVFQKLRLFLCEHQEVDGLAS